MGWVRNRVMQRYLQYRHQLNDRVEALRSIEKFDVHRITGLYEQRLSHLLHHAYHHTRYYRKLFDEHQLVNASGEIDIVRFTDIPFLNKATINSQIEEMKSDDLDKRSWFYNTSGGSTGEQAFFAHDQDFTRWSLAVKTLFDEWTGYSVGYPRMVLWGSLRDVLEGGESLWTRLGRWIRNERWQNAYYMPPGMRYHYLKRAMQFQPQQVLAYAESLYELARYAQQNDVPVHSPQAIMVSAGTLFPEMRQTIEQVFNSKVFNRYGSREVGDIACECEHHTGLHVSPYTQYVEIIRADGSHAAPEEIGEIVVTNLVNYAMPLIRYRIGDIGMWSAIPCSCGRHWPLLKEVSGRVTDVFKAKDGTQAYGTYFIQLLFFRDWIDKYQIVQEEVDHIEIAIVPKESSDLPENHRNDLEEISTKIRKTMGSDCRIEYRFTDRILPTPSGKYRYTISKVGANG